MKSEAAVTPEMLQAHPGLALLLTLFSMLIIALLAGCVSMWLWASVRWSSGQGLLAAKAWQPRSWGLLDLVVVGFTVLAAQAIGFKLWAEANGIDLRELKAEHSDSLPALATGASTLLAAMLLATLWLLIRYGATFHHLGLSLRQLPHQAGLGLAAAAMWLPVVILIMTSVSAGTGREYAHPLIERLTEDGTLGSYLLAVFCAVVAAPLVEEFFFRVLLQGWLQSIPWTSSSLWWLLGANRQQSPMAVAGHSIAASAPPVWPAWVAGTLFGLAHWDYGVSFVPLSVLGIVLGLLYRATQSIWPCFVLHFCLNAFSMAGLGLGLLVEAAQ